MLDGAESFNHDLMCKVDRDHNEREHEKPENLAMMGA